MKRLAAAFILLLLLATTAGAYQINVTSTIPVYQNDIEVHFLDNVTPLITTGNPDSYGSFLYQASFVIAADPGETGTANVAWEMEMRVQSDAFGLNTVTDASYAIFLSDAGGSLLTRQGLVGGIYTEIARDIDGRPVTNGTAVLAVSDAGNLALEFGVEYTVSVSMTSMAWAEETLVEWSEGDPVPVQYSAVTVDSYAFNLNPGTATAVPEPSTILLAGLGLAGLALLRKRFS